MRPTLSYKRPAQVMLALFGSDKSPLAIARKVATLAFEHAKNLAYFAAIYKGILVIGRLLHSAAGAKALAGAYGQPAAAWHAAVAGAVGAHFVWAPYSHLNFQIVLYLLSRVLVAAFKALARRGVPPFSSLRFPQVYPALAVATWAAVMFLFESDPASLHPSLAASMHEIYGGGSGGRGGAPVAAAAAGAAGSGDSLLALLTHPPPSLVMVVAFLLWDVGAVRFARMLRLPGSGAGSEAGGPQRPRP